MEFLFNLQIQNLLDCITKLDMLEGNSYILNINMLMSLQKVGLQKVGLILDHFGSVFFDLNNV